MIQTRIDDDLKGYYQTLDNRSVMGEVDIQQLIDDYRPKLEQINRRSQALEKEKTRVLKKQYGEMMQALSMDYSMVYFWNLDNDQSFPYWVSDNIRKQFGDDPAQLLTLEESVALYLTRIAAEDRDRFAQVTKRDNLLGLLTKQETCRVNYRVIRAEGTEHVQMKLARVGQWGENHNMVVTFRSIEEEISQERERTRLVEEALEQAEKASRAKTFFLNNVSHDIRTPMNAIIGFTTLAEHHVTDTRKVTDYLEKVKIAGNQLLSLVDDVLEMSSMENGRIELEEKVCELPCLMQDLAGIWQENMHRKALDFEVKLENVVNTRVICDDLRLEQMLTNCLDNALKFTNPGGKVTLKLSQSGEAKEGKAAFVFEIRDTGIGMSREFAEHIFEPFERARTSTVSGKQGIGLGMAITRSLVDMMQGEIRVDSKEGEGTCFTISLQFQTAGQEKPSVSGSSGEDSPEKNTAEQKDNVLLAGKTILLVEDVEINREIAGEILEEAGAGVAYAENGKEAVEKLEGAGEDEYDLVLMDIQMPVMDGYEATRRIRSMDSRGKASIPILALTANASGEDKKKALAAGMDGYLNKPVRVQELYDAIKQHI